MVSVYVSERVIFMESPNRAVTVIMFSVEDVGQGDPGDHVLYEAGWYFSIC